MLTTRYWRPCQSNSLGIWRRLSSLPIGGPSQAPPQALVPRHDQAYDPVGGEDHDQDQDHPVGDCWTGLLNGRGDLGWDPRLGGDPLVRLDGEEVGEDAAGERSRNRGEAANDSADQQLDREADRERVRAHETTRQAEERSCDPGIKS